MPKGFTIFIIGESRHFEVHNNILCTMFISIDLNCSANKKMKPVKLRISILIFDCILVAWFVVRVGEINLQAKLPNKSIDEPFMIIYEILTPLVFRTIKIFSSSRTTILNSHKFGRVKLAALRQLARVARNLCKKE